MPLTRLARREWLGEETEGESMTREIPISEMMEWLASKAKHGNNYDKLRAAVAFAYIEELEKRTKEEGA